MNPKITNTSKHMVINSGGSTKKFWMTEDEFTGIIVGKDASDSEYVITDGIMTPGAFVPAHYHKWEDQTFHVIQGTLEAKIGEETFRLAAGDTIHCPRGISHYLKNIGDVDAKLISYIFPGDWAEDFFEETSRQVKSGEFDFALIEERFGVVYI